MASKIELNNGKIERDKCLHMKDLRKQRIPVIDSGPAPNRRRTAF